MNQDYQAWQRISEQGQSETDSQLLELYLELETAAYDQILSNYPHVYSGTVASLADELGFSGQPVVFMGFLEGLSSSLAEAPDLEQLTPDSPLRFEINFETLFRKMNEAEADWLYQLESWELVLPQERRQAIIREWRDSKTVRSEKIGRNDPCPCGSGKKYKKCCGKGA
ncbi:MAG: SEC-C metal-binding domain-containing protein [Eubacteriales bacterium]|nr:SEC-C metal-binding domain-containing protein [Eubacteriales bacterium]MDD4462039.1 SEC-C metal-binding domain-containing protein [Eubacteriales bacterium]